MRRNSFFVIASAVFCLIQRPCFATNWHPFSNWWSNCSAMFRALVLPRDRVVLVANPIRSALRVRVQDLKPLTGYLKDWFGEISQLARLTKVERTQLRRYLQFVQARQHLYGPVQNLNAWMNFWRNNLRNPSEISSFRSELHKFRLIESADVDRTIAAYIHHFRPNKIQKKILQQIFTAMWEDYQSHLGGRRLSGMIERAHILEEGLRPLSQDDRKEFLRGLDDIANTHSSLRRSIQISEYASDETGSVARTNRDLEYIIQMRYMPAEMIPLREMRGTRVLDVGSGVGEFVMDLREHGVNAYGLDTNQGPPILDLVFSLKVGHNRCPLKQIVLIESIPI